MNNQYLLLHKTEWNRLKGYGKDPIKTIHDKREKYFKKLNEKSQNWLKTWPDTVQGIAYHMEKRKKEQMDEENAKLSAFLAKLKQTRAEQWDNRTKSIKRARELIFKDSSYGRQLFSTLLESKVLEERDSQIKFKRKLKEETLQTKNDGDKVATFSFAAKDERRKTEAKEIAEFNKTMFNLKKNKDVEQRRKEKQQEIEDAIMNAKLLKLEEQQENAKCVSKEDIEEFNAQCQKLKDIKESQEKYEDDLIALWQNSTLKINNKKKLVFEKIHKNRFNTPESRKNYQLLENILKEKEKSYNDFIEKGIKRSMEMEKKQEKIERTKAMTERDKRRLLDQENLKLSLIEQSTRQKDKTNVCNAVNKMKEKTRKRGPYTPFADQHKTLRERLKEREKEPSPWTATKGAHAQFFQHAQQTLEECSYKKNIRKLIQDYIKENNIDPASIDVANSKLEALVNFEINKT